MTAAELHDRGRDANVGKLDMKLELQIIPVSDVDRSKEFYGSLGNTFAIGFWRSLAWAFLLIWLAALLRKRNMQLKL